MPHNNNPKEDTTTSSLSRRLDLVPRSVMFDFADRIRKLQREGREIVDLSLGQPDVPAPEHIARAAQGALDHPLTSYSTPAGSPELRSLIAENYVKESGRDTSEANVIVTSGSKHALFISLLSLTDPDDEILVPEPYFPPYAEIAALTGASLKTVEVRKKGQGFQLDLDSLEGKVTRKTKVILVNYPNNPAGWTLSRNQIERLVDFCSSKGIFLLSDEIYDKIVFDGLAHFHAWQFSKGSKYVIGLGSFSKTYSMVPYRLGYVIAEGGVCTEMLKSQRATITMASPYIQAAGVAALKGPQEFVSERLKKYEERRDKCLRILKSEQIEVAKPEGAFYFLVEIPKIKDVKKFALDLLEHDNVAVLPGEIFGPSWKYYVRMSFATPDASLYLGIEGFAKRYKNESVGTD